MAGYFTDASIIRRVHREHVVGLAGSRALLMQAAHPVAFAGFFMSTGSLGDPYPRLRRTAQVLDTILFGERDDADRLTARVRRVHAATRGVLPVSAGRFPAGTPWAADDPELTLWILATLADSGALVYTRYVGGLTRAERDAYWQDWRVVGSLFGLREADMPADDRELRSYMREMLHGDILHVSQDARELGIRVVLKPPVPLTARPFLELANFITVGSRAHSAAEGRRRIDQAPARAGAAREVPFPSGAGVTAGEFSGARRLEDRVAVVTGAGHGIGAATARRLARDGAIVAVCDVRAQAAEETAAQIVADGLRARAFVADVADHDAVAGLVAHIERDLGSIEVLDNNAGRLVPGTALTQEIEEWERTLSVNVGSVFLMCRAVLPGMRERGSGVIVNTGSVSGLVGEPDLVAYNTSKAAIINLTRQLAADYSREGIRINCVCPGWIRTGFNDPLFPGWSEEAIQELVERQVPLGRQGTAEEIADAVAFLCSDDARYITGHALVVDGGLTATNL